MLEENIGFYSTGIRRIRITRLSLGLAVVVIDERLHTTLGQGQIQDILYDTLTDIGNHIIIIEMSDGRIIKTSWSNVAPEPRP